MNIIVDGLDATGKTTTINILAMLLERVPIKGSDFQHATQGNQYLYEKFYNFTYLDNTIFDRFHISNLVYADIYKDYAIITPEQTEIIEDRLKDRSKVFYLYADLDVVKERLASRGDDYVKTDMIETISNKYDEVLSQSKLDIVKIDTTNRKPLEVAQEILRECGYAEDN